MKTVREANAHQVVLHPDYGWKMALNPTKSYDDDDPLVIAFPQFFTDVVTDPTTATEPTKAVRKRAAKATSP